MSGVAAVKWFSMSYVSGEGKFKMVFNVAEGMIDFMKGGLEKAGGSAFVLVAQPCHYSPWGLESAGFYVPAVAAALSKAAEV